MSKNYSNEGVLKIFQCLSTRKITLNLNFQGLGGSFVGKHEICSCHEHKVCIPTRVRPPNTQRHTCYRKVFKIQYVNSKNYISKNTKNS